MTIQLEEANARLHRKRSRAAREYPAEAAPIRNADLESTLRRLEEQSLAYEDASCAFCRRTTVDLGEVPVSCGLRACVEAADARRWAELPKSDMLRVCVVPDRYRLDPFTPSYYRSGWPKELRDRPRAEFWGGDPPTVLLCGPNSSGKSMLAAEMMYRAIRGGVGNVKSGFWVRPTELVREDREAPLGHPRQLMHRARTTGILVVDDFGRTDDRIDDIADLCEIRLSARRLTIWTTHRSFNKGKKSLMLYARMIFTRLRDHAWIFPLEAAGSEAAK